MKTCLVTGAAGFIGYHFSKRLIASGYRVVGLDNLNTYYDVSLKEARISALRNSSSFEFVHADLNDGEALSKLFSDNRFNYVVNLAAQAGVRHSLTAPFEYLDSNVSGFLHLLEACRTHQPEHFIFASSSSVYGLDTERPSKIVSKTDRPASLYAATKKANELMAHAYANLFDVPSSGLRFFTVYGPWGRPDMALFKFVRNILADRSIDIYNNGEMLRDFTYVDDIVEAMENLLPLPPERQLNHGDADGETPAFRVLNIGNGNPVPLMTFVKEIENTLGKSAIINFLPLQEGDVVSSHADTTELFDLVGFRPNTPVSVGIERFCTWYREYYEQEQDD